MATVKPSNPEAFEGRRDALTVSTWLHQVEVCLDVLQVTNPQVPLDENVKISLASSFMKGPAAHRWFMLDAVRESRDKLRSLIQKTSVSAYLNQFRNLVIAIPGINEAENLDRFCSDLKPTVRLEVLKASPASVTAESQIALNLDSALIGSGMFNAGGFRGTDRAHSGNLGSDPMDIENMEGQRPDFESNRITHHRKEIKNNACFYVINAAVVPGNMQTWSVSTQIMSFWTMKSKSPNGKLTGRPINLTTARSDLQWVVNNATSQERRLMSGIISDLGRSSPIVYGILDNVSSSVTALPFRPLFVFRGMLNGIAVNVLEDDGCNTNVISANFLRQKKDKFNFYKANVTVNYAQQDVSEESSEIVLNGTLSIGSHSDTSNWIVAKCRYDTLLSMPWHVANSPCFDCVRRAVREKDNDLNIEGCQHGTDGNMCKVSNMSVKSFRRTSRKGLSENVRVFQIVVKVGSESFGKMKKRKNDSRLDALLKSFGSIFKSELPAGLPPKRAVEHKVFIEEEAEKPPHHPLYHLSPAELNAAEEYVEDLMMKGKIRRSSSPYGALLFFVKEPGKLCGFFDYRALNKISKRNHSPIPRSDEMFYRIRGAKMFSRLDLRSGFHQIRVKPEDVEKTAFNTKYSQFEYLLMPMGASNAPATFQAPMNEIFHECIYRRPSNLQQGRGIPSEAPANCTFKAEEARAFRLSGKTQMFCE